MISNIASTLLPQTCVSPVYVGFGVIHSESVVEAFRAVDRQYFVPKVSCALCRKIDWNDLKVIALEY